MMSAKTEEALAESISTHKGKGIDPKNWGVFSNNNPNMDIECQHAVLYLFALLRAGGKAKNKNKNVKHNKLTKN
jgi:hypothetical protein